MPPCAWDSGEIALSSMPWCGFLMTDELAVLCCGVWPQLAFARQKGGSLEEQVVHACDKLNVLFGTEILKDVPGFVSTEVNADLSFDVEASIRKAHEFIAMYEEAGVPRERVLIKLASTWEVPSVHSEERNCSRNPASVLRGCVDTRIRTYTHTHIQTYTHMNERAHTHTCIRTHMCT